MRHSFMSLSCLAVTFIGLTAEAETWPFPQDTPQNEALAVQLAGQSPVDISRFLLSRGVRQSQLNSQGTHLAYVYDVTGVPQLWVQDISTGRAKQLTYGNGISFYEWHPDGERLIYGADNDGNEREAFYLISRSGLQEQVILPHSDGFRAFGGFSEDGSKFSYASTERNGRDFDIYLHDLANAKSAMIWQAEFGFFPAAWQPGSQAMIVTETRGEDAQDVYLLDAVSGKMTQWFKPAVAAAFESFTWAKDGKQVWFTSNLEREMMALFRFEPAKQSLTLIRESEHDIEQVVRCANESVTAWTENQRGFDTLYTQHTGQPLQQLELPAGVYSLSCAQDKPLMSIQISSATAPNKVYLLDLASGQMELIRDAELAGIDETQLVTPHAIEFPARDGVTLHGLLYLPNHQTSLSKVPLVVDVHGGPTAQARPTWGPLTQYLVGQGIAVLDINVRGSTGYGKTFTRLDNQEKRLDSVRDLVDALAYLKDDVRIDTGNAAVMGGSYGGYMVNAVMGLYPGEFKAGASFVGVSDWVRALETASPGLKASDRIEYGDIREEHWQRFYAQNSPINTVHNITAPMFFEHGVNDPRDPVTESDQMVEVLRKKGLDVTYLRFPDEGHSVTKLENRVIFYRQLAAFLERHLKEKNKR